MEPTSNFLTACSYKSFQGEKLLGGFPFSAVGSVDILAICMYVPFNIVS